MKNQRPINAYFESSDIKTPGKNRDNGVSVRKCPFVQLKKNHFQRNLLGVNDSSSDYGVTPFENGSHLPASGGSTPQRNHKARKPRAEVTSREVTCQTDMTRYEMDRLESGQAQKVRFRRKCHFLTKF